MGERQQCFSGFFLNNSYNLLTKEKGEKNLDRTVEEDWWMAKEDKF